MLLRRFLTPDQIILNPMKRGSAEEFTDVVCGTGAAVLVIQAKDSPNTALSLARPIARKMQTSASQLKDALSQISGALRHAAQAEPILLTIKTGDIDLHIAGREVVGVVLIKEIFLLQAAAVLAALSEHRSQGGCLVVLDYSGFAAFVHHFPEEDRFVAELKAYSATMLEANAWIPAHAFLIRRFLDDSFPDAATNPQG